tara:strand:- start:866 stop:1528 length:663 start_codon:yes stop_codon:yes gene_type:complete
MKKHINKFLIASQKIKKEWVFCFLLAVGFIVACQGALEEGNPFGPSNSNIVIVQSSSQINKGGTQNFTALGGTLPLSWSLSATQIGAIDAGTGVFTAAAAPNQVAGIATVTVVDAVGDTDTATIEILPNALVITPGSSTQFIAGTEEFTVAGAANVVATISNNNSTSTFALPTLAFPANVVTVTFTQPTAGEGNQTFTITITDAENGDVGSVVLTLIAAA